MPKRAAYMGLPAIVLGEIRLRSAHLSEQGPPRAGRDGQHGAAPVGGVAHHDAGRCSADLHAVG